MFQVLQHSNVVVSTGRKAVRSTSIRISLQFFIRVSRRPSLFVSPALPPLWARCPSCYFGSIMRSRARPCRMHGVFVRSWDLCPAVGFSSITFSSKWPHAHVSMCVDDRQSQASLSRGRERVDGRHESVTWCCARGLGCEKVYCALTRSTWSQFATGNAADNKWAAIALA